MNTHNVTNPNHSTGPRTPQGKAVASRNATTHGLYAAQTVLPHLGEDPEAYDAMHQALCDQLRPRNLMECQYLELWLQASWKIARLQRLEDQAWQHAAEDNTDNAQEDALLTKIERLTRLQSSLRRQMDRALRQLTADLPALFARRTREDVLKAMNLTEAILEKYPYRKDEVEKNVQANSYWPDLSVDGNKKCQNELPSPTEDAEEAQDTEALDAQLVDDGVTQNTQNEPPPLPPVSGGMAEERGQGGSSGSSAPDYASNYLTDRCHRQRSGIRPRLSAALQPTIINEAEETRLKYEHALNDLSIPWADRQQLIEMIGQERLYDTETGFRIQPE